MVRENPKVEEPDESQHRGHRAPQGLGGRCSGCLPLDEAGAGAHGRGPDPEDPAGAEPEGRVRLHELRLAGPGPPQDVRVLRKRGQGRHLGSNPGGGRQRISGPRHPVSELRQRSEYWLGMQGRLTEPVYKPAGEDHYRPVSWEQAFGILADKLKSLPDPGPGRLLHQRPHLQRGRVPVPAVRPGFRHQQPSRLLQHVPRVLWLGHGPDHRRRQGHRLLRRLRQGRPDHHHGPEPGHQPPAHAHRAGGSQRGRLPDRGRQPAARSRPDAVQEPAEGQGHHRPRHGPGRPVPADPDRRGHGAAAGGLQARARRRSRQSRASVLDHAFLDGALRRARGAPGAPGRSWTRRRPGGHRPAAPRKSTNSQPATSLRTA